MWAPPMNSALSLLKSPYFLRSLRFWLTTDTLSNNHVRRFSLLLTLQRPPTLPSAGHTVASPVSPPAAIYRRGRPATDAAIVARRIAAIISMDAAGLR